MRICCLLLRYGTNDIHRLEQRQNKGEVTAQKEENGKKLNVQTVIGWTSMKPRSVYSMLLGGFVRVEALIQAVWGNVFFFYGCYVQQYGLAKF